jgi:hypothetical protein
MTYSRTLTTICPLLAAAVLGLAQSPAPKAVRAPRADAWEQTPAPTPRPAAAPVIAPMPRVQEDAWDQTPAPTPRPAAAPAIAPMPRVQEDAWDQTPAPPEPPVPPAPAIAPMPADAWEQITPPPVPPVPPAPAIAPMPPVPPVGWNLDAPMALAWEIQDKFQYDFDLQDQIERAKEMAGRFKFDAEEMKMKAKAMADMSGMKMAFAPQVGAGFGGKTPPTPPMPPQARRIGNMSDDRLYSAGQSSLENRQWDQAIEYFSQVVSRGGNRADGALYWKAYALGKQGKRDEGLAAIAELRKSYANSRWLDDAKALELELKQASGQTVSPESESDEELKLMAINGLMQSDPERAMPLLEKQLKGSGSPRVKRNALFVLAQSSSPKAQTMLEQIARGGANPDLQVKAITYMTERRRNNANANTAQILSEIYASTTDIPVKRAILSAYVNLRDKDRLLQAAKSEKAPELREIAISYLGETQGNPELWQLYQAETTPEGKIQLLRYMHSNSNSEKLLEVVRNEKDPKVRIAAMQALASQRSGLNADALVSLYNAEQDQQMKQRILDNLMGQRNAKALVDIARAEKDQKMKLRIVERLANMKDKEAQDYLQEILSK